MSMQAAKKKMGSVGRDAPGGESGGVVGGLLREARGRGNLSFQGQAGYAAR